MKTKENMTKCQSSLENFRRHNLVFVGVKDLQKILLLSKLSLQPTDYYRKVRAHIAAILPTLEKALYQQYRYLL
jgi:hypothetical protein